MDDRIAHGDGFRGRVSRLFHPGPLAWILGLMPKKDRFHPGGHLHGLDEEPQGSLRRRGRAQRSK